MKPCVNCNVIIGFFNRSYNCASCHIDLCSACASPVDISVDEFYVSILQRLYNYDEQCTRKGHLVFCHSCMNKFMNEYYKLVNGDENTVSLYSENYKGRRPNSSNFIWHMTDFYKNQD